MSGKYVARICLPSGFCYISQGSLDELRREAERLGGYVARAAPLNRALRRPHAGDDDGARRPLFYYKCNVNGRWLCVRKDVVDRNNLFDILNCVESHECDMIVVNDIIGIMRGVGRYG